MYDTIPDFLKHPVIHVCFNSASELIETYNILSQILIYPRTIFFFFLSETEIYPRTNFFFFFLSETEIYPRTIDRKVLHFVSDCYLCEDENLFYPMTLYGISCLSIQMRFFNSIITNVCKSSIMLFNLSLY